MTPELYKLVEKADRLISRKVPRGDVIYVSVPGGTIEVRKSGVVVDSSKWSRYIVPKGRSFEAMLDDWLDLMDDEYEYVAQKRYDYGEEELSFDDFIQETRGYDWFVKAMKLVVEDLRMYDPYEDRAATVKDGWEMDTEQLKDQLVKLGSRRVDLRPHIREILSSIKKKARRSQFFADFTQKAADKMARKAGYGEAEIKIYSIHPKNGLQFQINFKDPSPDADKADDMERMLDRFFPAFKSYMTTHEDHPQAVMWAKN